MGTTLDRPASTLFVAVAFLVVAILVIATPGLYQADSEPGGVVLVGP
jgi:uncharacterized membrane protein